MLVMCLLWGWGLDLLILFICLGCMVLAGSCGFDCCCCYDCCDCGCGMGVC